MESKKKSVVIIGAGITGLCSSALLAKKGFDVTIVDQNPYPGGRIRVKREKGFVFDMGPTWYLMPETFEKFFQFFGKKAADYYSLEHLDPGFKVFYEGKMLDVPAGLDNVKKLFESFESGSAQKLEKYLSLAEYKYTIAMQDFLYKEYQKITDFMDKRMLFEGLKMDIFKSLDAYIQKFFKHPLLRKILSYNVVFLGSGPKNIPALYSIMSHVDLKLGVWYPKGGMWNVADAVYRLAKEQGVHFCLGQDVRKIEVKNNLAGEIITDQQVFKADIVLNTGDYPYGETVLLEKKNQTYKKNYWNRKVLAPSMFLIFLGLNKKLKNLAHHNFYFPENWDAQFDAIFKKPAWIEHPAYYIGCPSKTDPSVAPQGKDLLFMLVPLAAGLEDSPEQKDKYRHQVLSHLENLLGESIQDSIEVEHIFSHGDFSKAYHAYKGTALGLAHTLFQTAIFRPGLKSKKVKNLYYAGQYTHPGVGLPMAFIAAEIIAGKIEREA